MNNQYVYILSNPAMPGLLKIGKTTTHPSQRMAELMSTGVPKPFVLECSLIVEDCHSAEVLVHQKLISYRVSLNREFFQLDIKSAMEIILPTIGNYTIHYARSSFNVAELERAIILNNEIKEKERVESTLKLQAEQLKKRKEIELKVSQLELELSKKQELLQSLGERPENMSVEGFLSWFIWIAYPVPVGWIFWGGALRFFENPSLVSSWICIALVLLGIISKIEENKCDKINMQIAKKFDSAEEDVQRLKEEIALLSRI